MAPDQLHEQNNENIKGVGGGVHLVNRTNQSGLIKWELCGPEIVRLVEQFENCTDAEEKFDNAKKHHEDNFAYQQRFCNDLQNVIDGMICNPFELDELTAINNTKNVFDTTVFKGISILEATGEKQFLRFWEDRLLNGRYSVDMKIPKNSILLPRNADSKSDAFSKPTYSTLTLTLTLTKLHSAIHARKTLSINLFSTEIGGVAQCLAETNRS